MAYTYKEKKPVLQEPGPAPTAPTIDPYQSIYGDEIGVLADKIANRDPFAYNQNNDPAFKAYAEQYLRLGDRAMQDTIGQAAANTGGIASSYAVSAAAQAKAGYNQQLMGVIPELMDAAYQRYQGEFNMDNQALGSLQGLEDAAYNKWSDNRDFTWNQYETGLGQYNADRGYNLDVYGMNLDQWNADRDFGFDQYTYEKDFKYQQQQDAIDNAIARSRASGSGGGGDDEYQLPADYKPSMNATSLRVDMSYYKTDPEKAQAVIKAQYEKGLLTDNDVIYLMGIFNK